MPTLTIDGKEITVAKGTTVLEAAKALKIHIPHYCYHPALSVVGNCRMCLVKIEGMPKLQTSCSTAATENMKVLTKTDEVKKAQEGVMEFLLINHPLDCPVCDQGGECDLQDFSYGYGKGKSRYEFEKQTFVERNLGPVIKLNMNRCIRCTRCIRFCQEVRGKAELDLFFRGQHSEIATYEGRDLTGSLQGNLADVCPVGALTTKDYRFKSRPWENRDVKSICPFCEKGCSISLTVRWRTSQLLRIQPRYNPNVNGHWMCDHGRFGFHGIFEGQRSQEPLVASASGPAHASLEQAYGLVYERARQIRESHGAAAGAALGSTHASNEDNFMLRKFASDAFHGASLALNERENSGEGEEYAGFTIPAYKAPNREGAKDAGFGGGSYAMLRDRIRKGDVKALFVLGGNQLSDWGSDISLLRSLDLLVVFELLPSPLREFATVCLPAAAWTETDGTMTNAQGRIQRFWKGMDAPAAVLPQWKTLVELGRRFGLQGYESLAKAEDVFALMAATVPGYAGLDYAKLGDRGLLKTVEEPVGAS